jgi:hypothetical protein
MQINLIYDSSTTSAPSTFFTVMNAAAQYLDNLITNNITVNIQVGWGEVGGQTLGAGDLGQGGANGVILSYAQLNADLLANSNSAADATAYANLPSTDISNGAGFFVSAAEEKAWGLLSATGSEVDGAVGFGTSGPYNYSTTATGVAGEYSLLGVALHELTHALGRDSGLNASSSLGVMDLFQYTSPGVIQTTVGGSSYFSINGGVTNLANFSSTSDLADWSNTVPNDSFDAFATPGTANPMSKTDITLMNVLGFNVSSSTGPGTGPVVNSVTAATDDSSSTVGAGHVVTLTLNASEAVIVTGTPTLQLSDNEVATYASGSGTNALTFYYVAQPGDSTADLHVTGLNLPTINSAIMDSSGNSLSTTLTADLGIGVNAAVAPPATTIQQEVLGLYAAVYGRAADAAGLAYWEGMVGAVPEGAGTTAITTQNAELLGKLFVITESAYFNATYGSLNDSQFIAALYTNIGGNSGDPSGNTYWTGQLAALEAHGASVQMARSEIVGAFVQEFIDYNLSTQPAGLTTAEYQAAVQRQAAFDNKLAVSDMYAYFSLQPGGTILNAHTTTDAAYAAATAAIHNVTSNPTTAETVIGLIQQAVANNNLALI